METAPLTTPRSDPAIATAATLPSSEASTVLSSDFETFLKMLTAQAEYQDPMEPIDSSEYAAQLAQFSMVEQQVLANDRLAEMTAQLQLATMTQLAGLIGMEARTEAPVRVAGAPVTVATAPVAEADRAFLVVKNGQGLEVHREEIDLAPGRITWRARTSEGGALPPGPYGFEVENWSQGAVLSSEVAAAYLPIREARSLEGGPGLILEGGTELLAQELAGLRGA